MICPACTNELSVKTVAGIDLDVCERGCGGIWFDQFEFKKFDEKSEPDAESILHIEVKAPAPEKTQLACPKCKPQLMMRHFSSVKRNVTVDECPQCAGIWLDASELTKIRDEFESEADRYKAAENVFDDLFGSTLEAEKRKSREHLAKVQRFAIFTRNITRS